MAQKTVKQYSLKRKSIGKESIQEKVTNLDAGCKTFTTEVIHKKNAEALKKCIHPLSEPKLLNVAGFSQESSSNCMHDNSHMTDASAQEGPICYDFSSNKLCTEAIIQEMSFRRSSKSKLPSMCPTFVFDRFNNLITINFSLALINKDKDEGKVEISLLHIDYKKFETTDTLPLPDRGIKILKVKLFKKEYKKELQKTHGGTYFFIDNQNRAIIPCSDNHIFIIPILEYGFDQDNIIKLNTKLLPEEDKLIAVSADNKGHLWFTSRKMGIGVFQKLADTSYDLKPTMLDIKPIANDAIIKEVEQIQNSCSADVSGINIITSRRILKVGWDDDGKAALIWEAPYENDGIHRDGHLFAGSGTTPTVFGNNLIGICNNAAHFAIEIFDSNEGAKNHKLKDIRLFEEPKYTDKRACENSIVAHGDFLVVGNTFGYVFPLADNNPRRQNDTIGGLQKVRYQDTNSATDRDTDGDTWFKPYDIKSAVPKLSSSSGILYIYNNVVIESNKLNKKGEKIARKKVVWRIQGIDFRNGDILFEIPVGSGPRYNNIQGTFALGAHNSLVVCGYHGFNKITMKKPV
jgi:hypothetical protein